MLGFLWTVVNPLVMLAVYAFVFGGIFQARWGIQGHVSSFVEMLYCGLIVYNIFAETLTRSPNAVIANPGYVKKVVFPLELLPICHLASALFNAVVSLILLCIFLVIHQQYIPITALLTPVILLPLILLTGGVAWLLASVGVFFRDLGQIIGVVMSIMLFLSPIFYPAAAAPALAAKLMYLNPLTYPIEETRNVLVLGILPNWIHWITSFCVSLLIGLFGLWAFQRARPAFADVI